MLELLEIQAPTLLSTALTLVLLEEVFAVLVLLLLELEMLALPRAVPPRSLFLFLLSLL